MNTSFRLDPLPRGVIVAATPLGNIADASARLMQALQHADIVAAEDTRRVRNLAQALGIEIRGKVVSNFDHNEEGRAAQLVEAARSGTVLVVSDAGMPLVSDPGHSIVAAAVEAGVPVTCFPGPSAVPTALALSGLGVGHFLFDAFAPRKAGPRKAWLESLRGEKRAIVFFESPHRLAQTLADAAAVLGEDRPAAVCRELTKTYEEVKRGSLGELAKWAEDNARGEITVVIEGGEEVPSSLEELVDKVQRRVADGVRAKDACKEVAAGTQVSNRELYDAFLSARDSEK
ncbi:rRNA (cytidine-2'-O-)-methyltransferase [Corynebacterium sp. HMSC06D04]|uniref:Ribosomal RNA small subunit methyltransferase I n=1 Tax=Corynebacterium simulans TaxID=146827 RepID=A0ABR5VAA4_9CORY|nr:MULTISPECIES: 16S rRNA (cytidine(1402)-2'-O)-methyltransferase [Corynebacterium]KXU18529.1 tetrapyrrole (Corrin/Porphyrin) Methylases family protein [Corynebacterium simulans]OFL97531.1 rRNA (cytidine-2'-O-)-methyltransferase [Corynebacterium sp. HMSC071F07]OFR40379.1 rRNA (cytidine-2'-O-)-methyltransferase [Corynebacterium sp. HMSC077D03]OFT34360.1 rRNA (cytidine-2'-O-)-methyltransferase [Corynebacterium sp. HMSC08C04]OFT49034.1 rRNA (cytidine-2'-O-)-methyltransferase [Corynebacterium sp. 